MTRILPEGFQRGPMQGQHIIGEVTESLHKFLMDGWTSDKPAPRIDEDISFVPKDREEVLYIYMYRTAHNDALQNSKRLRESKITVRADANKPGGGVYYERPPLYLDLYYMIAVHSKFRSDAERLLGWVLLRLHEATHLVYRPRRYLLPDGREVDSMGRPWRLDAEGGDDLIMEKVALALIDDLTVGDAINFFTIHEAPYRPFLTYRARCAMEGSLISAPGATTIRNLPLEAAYEERPAHERPNGRLGRVETRPRDKKTPFGPEGQDFRPIEDNNESED